MKDFKTKAGTELPLLNMRGKPYLQVAHRLVWFREERPEWSIETEIVERTSAGALMKATIKDDKGKIIAQGHKMETPQGFADYLEKAETGAIGRALAMCGYGTQFCSEELDEGDRLADSPVAMKSNPHAEISPGIPGPNDGSTTGGPWRAKCGSHAGKGLNEITIEAWEQQLERIEERLTKFPDKKLDANWSDLYSTLKKHVLEFNAALEGKMKS